MKHILISSILIFTISSCKKSYTCECTSGATINGSNNPKTYSLKERNSNKALENCVMQYESFTGSNSGGIICNIK